MCTGFHFSSHVRLLGFNISLSFLWYAPCTEYVFSSFEGKLKTIFSPKLVKLVQTLARTFGAGNMVTSRPTEVKAKVCALWAWSARQFHHFFACQHSLQWLRELNESLKENWWFLAMLVVGPPLSSRLKYIYYIYISITRIAMKFWYRHAWSPEAKPSGQNFHLKYFNIYWLAQHFALFSWFWLSL